MTDAQQRRAIECATKALKTKTINTFKAMAKLVLEKFADQQTSCYGGKEWSCIVSEYRTSECHHTGPFIELQIGELIKIDLFKSEQQVM